MGKDEAEEKGLLLAGRGAAGRDVLRAMPDEQVRKSLHMPAGEPCLLVIRRTWAHGRIVSYARLWHPGSRFELTGEYAPLFWFEIGVGLGVPFVLLAIVIFWMYHVLAHRPGGQPIGALERAASKSWAFVRRILPRPRAA